MFYFCPASTPLIYEVHPYLLVQSTDLRVAPLCRVTVRDVALVTVDKLQQRLGDQVC